MSSSHALARSMPHFRPARRSALSCESSQQSIPACRALRNKRPDVCIRECECIGIYAPVAAIAISVNCDRGPAYSGSTCELVCVAVEPAHPLGNVCTTCMQRCRCTMQLFDAGRTIACRVSIERTGLRLRIVRDRGAHDVRAVHSTRGRESTWMRASVAAAQLQRAKSLGSLLQGGIVLGEAEAQH
jgi:hypothetical protein